MLLCRCCWCGLGKREPRAYARMFLTEKLVHSPYKTVVIPSGFSELRKLRRRGMREAESREESFAA
jgi:hypothetical protein